MTESHLTNREKRGFGRGVAYDLFLLITTVGLPFAVLQAERILYNYLALKFLIDWLIDKIVYSVSSYETLDLYIKRYVAFIRSISFN